MDVLENKDHIAVYVGIIEEKDLFINTPDVVTDLTGKQT